MMYWSKFKEMLDKRLILRGELVDYGTGMMSARIWVLFRLGPRIYREVYSFEDMSPKLEVEEVGEYGELHFSPRMLCWDEEASGVDFLREDQEGVFVLKQQYSHGIFHKKIAAANPAVLNHLFAMYALLSRKAWRSRGDEDESDAIELVTRRLSRFIGEHARYQYQVTELM